MLPLTALYLVRHGQSAANVNPAMRGPETPLTEVGRAQALRAAAAVSELGVEAVYSSPYRRARETAEPIAAALGLQVRPVEGFGEVDMGRLSNPVTPEECAAREATFSAMLAGDPSSRFPGGEEFADVVARVRSALRALVREKATSSRIAVVTHRVPIAAAAWICDPAGGPARAGTCGNASITTLRPEPDGHWALVAWADVSHLG